MTAAQQLSQHVKQQVGTVVFGMDDAIDGLTIALIAKGHVLIQGVPGLGKTLLAKTFSSQLGGKFKRIQCTADLMPSDITGIHIFRQGQSEFELIPGPVFADVLLVDEINRTGPKTQSALLQAMEEGKVTIDRTTYDLPDDFLVIASQNPSDFEGTYPLPESQVDRFLIRLDVQYQSAEVESKVLQAYDKPGGGHEQAEVALNAVPANLLSEARQQAAGLHVDDAVYQYAVGIGAASRVHPQVSLGLSTRGVLSLMRCARVRAAMQGHDFVNPDDIKALAVPVMAHRLTLTPDAALDGIEASAIVQTILDHVEVPR